MCRAAAAAAALSCVGIGSRVAFVVELGRGQIEIGMLSLGGVIRGV